MFQHRHLMIRPDPARTVVRPFAPGYPDRFRRPGHDRAQVIVDRVLGLDDEQLAAEERNVSLSLDERHRDVGPMLDHRFEDMADQIAGADAIAPAQRRLIGAYFSEEYAFAAAALFNPSAVLHPDQSGLADGQLRYLISLRGIGEGHVSSVAFRTGTWTPGGELCLDAASEVAVPPVITQNDSGDGVVCLDCSGSRDLSETVIFPVLPRQRQGIEDMRLVRFTEDDGGVRYYGTYTAFSGSDAKPELLLTEDFRHFAMKPLSGDAAGAKGMALFPRRIDGRFVMLGRQDSENIWLHHADEPTRWDGGAVLIAPRYPWEFVQMGNCGSPIELDEGWLVLTHGVGTVRNYCMGAALLDKADPTKLLARTPKPILEPSPDERDGYVPNVVYSCGALLHGRELMLPYGVSDQFTSFATCSVDELLAAMA
ncbi:glycoside hydrolase family 130 protein [Sphingomonas bacterium]|uniref:glycoside hydrolase family 130 protein n=1 Tax=Sphingomonas bacterium TaxID=1895847 RepID=UPI0020C6437E|nr:glycoside hydrolase family 130 protein [Sphingomonas bacterium]